MRALILLDELFAVRERAMLGRLEVGLQAEGVRAVHAIPEQAGMHARSDVFSLVVTYEKHGLTVTRKRRVARFIDNLREVLDGNDDPVDVIHVFGGSSWTFASEVASELNVPVALEVWRSGIISRAVSFERPASALFAPDERMVELIRTASPDAQVRLTPWGVHVPGDDRKILKPKVSPAIVVGGTGRDKQAFHNVAEALALIVRTYPDVVVFFDASAAHRSGTWKAAREYGILDHISLIDELEVHRELVLHADLLLFPEATGEHRTLLLDAMAHQMAIVAADDDAHGALRDETACIIRDADPRAWSTAIRDLLEHPDRARALGGEAKQYVREHHRGSTQVASVLDAYEWMTSSDSVPFDQ